MSDQSVILPKWFTHGGITLAKGQLGHSYTFWTRSILIFRPVANFGQQSMYRLKFSNFWPPFPLFVVFNCQFYSVKRQLRGGRGSKNFIEIDFLKFLKAQCAQKNLEWYQMCTHFRLNIWLSKPDSIGDSDASAASSGGKWELMHYVH